MNLWNEIEGVEFTLDLKFTFSLQYGKFPSIVRLRLVLQSSEGLPNYDKTQVNFLLGTMKLRFLYKYFIQKIFDAMIHEILKIVIMLKYWLQSFNLLIKVLINGA